MKRATTTLLFLPLFLAACASGPGGRGGDMDGPPGGMGGSTGTVVSQLQDQIQQTAEALKLTPKQNTLWDAYVEKVSALMADQMKRQTYHPKKSAMQHIGDKVDTVRNRLTAMEEIQEAASKLYSALDDNQKKTADQMLPGTLPALYSGLGSSGGGGGSERHDGSRRGPAGGMGGGFGRM